MGPLEVLDMAGVVHLGDGPDVGGDSFDRHDGQDPVHVGLVRGVDREDERGRRLFDPGTLQVRAVGRIAADEVDALSGRVLLHVGEDDDLGLVLVAAELLDQLPGGRVPAADDDVVLVSGGAQSLALLEQEVDDERHEGPRDGSDDRDSEQDEQPAHDEAARACHEAGIALAEDREDGPVEGLPEPFDGGAGPLGPGLLDERHEEGRDGDEDRRAFCQAEEEAPVDGTRDPLGMPRDAPHDRRGQERVERIEATIEHGVGSIPPLRNVASGRRPLGDRTAR